MYGRTRWRTLCCAVRPALALRRQIRSIADARPFVAGDLVLLRPKLDRSAPPILTKPLKVGRTIQSHYGAILHDDIIGKRVRDVIKTSPLRSGRQETEFRLHEVKLEEYVRLTRRLVTPIYPADARLIVELSDLHIDTFDPQKVHDDEDPKLEVLEAGTGHGALTLYLSRAIHGANPPFPSAANDDENAEDAKAALTAWKNRRRAVVHTIEHSSRYAAHAEYVVKGFRRGLYHPHVDFHVTDVAAWVRKSLVERDYTPFLSHAFLDLPGAEAHLSTVSQALRTDGCLVVFNPSITQIIDCATEIKERNIALELETVVELGVNGSSAGREWSMRPVRPRVRTVETMDQIPPEKETTDLTNTDDATELPEEEEADAPAVNAIDGTASQQYSMICRPKVGERIVGGGFLGVWRKQRDMRPPS